MSSKLFYVYISILISPLRTLNEHLLYRIPWKFTWRQCCFTESNFYSSTIYYNFVLSIEAATGGVLLRKGVLRNFAKFAGKHLCQSLYFNKVETLKIETLTQVFSSKFAKFLRTPLLQNTSGRMLLCQA